MKVTYSTYCATVKEDATPDLKRYGIAFELPAGTPAQETFDLYHDGALDALTRKRAELEAEGQVGKWGGVIRVVEATDQEREPLSLPVFEILSWKEGEQVASKM
jgi:hypothetical protein